MTIFSHMSALAQAHGALNLAQGFPDFPMDARLAGLVTEALQQGANQYAPMAGLPVFQETIAQKLLRDYGVSVDPGPEITITPGATYALYVAARTVLNAGDACIVLEPAYDSYVPAIEAAGAQPVFVPLLPQSFRPDFDRIEAAITPRTKAIFINTPHNPTGTVWLPEDWRILEALVLTHGLYVISDEVYDGIVFDDRSHHSALQREGLRSRSLVCFSYGKSTHTTGWKVGSCIAPPELTIQYRNRHQYLAFSVNTPMQWALARYLSPNWYVPPANTLQPKRDLLIELMRDTPFRLLEPAAGTYFQLADYSAVSDLPEQPFAEWLTRTHGVATIPVSAFYHDGCNQHLIRLCFAKKEETLRAAAERLRF
jgi:methionine aminotransferase